MHYHAAEVYLYEIGLHVYPSGEKSGVDESQRLELLVSCVNAAKAYFDVYHTLPKTHYPYFPFTIWIQSGLVLLTSVRLAVFEHEAWDVTYARLSLNVSAVLEREIECILQAIQQPPQAQDGGERKNILHGFLRRMQKLKESYEDRIRNEATSEQYADINPGTQVMDGSFNLANSFWDLNEDDLNWLWSGTT